MLLNVVCPLDGSTNLKTAPPRPVVTVLVPASLDFGARLIKSHLMPFSFSLPQ